MKEIITVLILLIMLAACGADGASPNETENVAVNEVAVSVPVEEGAGDTAVTTLHTNYADALSVEGQLAIGTVQLEETELAVDEALAAELLPLWQAYQSLSLSDTTAEAELQAVVNQIEKTMTPTQIAAIAEMKLTNERLTALMQSDELGFGAGGRGNVAAGGAAAAGNGGGGFAGGPGGGGFIGAPGGGSPGGGFPGGPGGGPDGGPGGAGGANLSEEEIATRQAQFEQGGTTGLQARLLPGLVVRLLEGKLGIVSEVEVQRKVMQAALTAVAEAANLTVAELQAQLSEGQTMAAIVEANGGDVAALQTQLVEIFGDLPDADELDLAQSVNEWLGLEE